MKPIFLVVATALMILSAFPYIRDILKGNTKPNIVSWITWTLLSGIAAAAAISAGEFVAATFTGAVAVESASVVILGIRKGFVKYGAFDIACQLGAVVGIVLWQVFKSPAIGVAATVIIDLVGASPTLVHCWRQPAEETLSTYALAAAAGVFALLALSTYNWVSLPNTIYVLVIDVVFVAIIAGRRRQLANVTQA